MKNLFKDIMVCASVAILSLMGTMTMAATTIFSENWDSSGGVLSGDWVATTTGHPNDAAELEEIAPGDWAMYTRSSVQPDSNDNHFYSTATYARGDDIRCQFLVWIDPNKPGWQAQFPNVATVNGPWRQTSTGPAYGNQEAAVSLWINQPLRFSQNEWNTGHVLSGAYNAAWVSADSKANGILHQVGLDDTLGAYFQWSTDGGNTWNLEQDTRGQSGSNQAANLYLGWASGGYAVFIDDIEVITGSGSDLPGAPDPTPTPFPAPGPLLFDDFGGPPCALSNLWLVAVQESMFNGDGVVGIEEVNPGDCAYFLAGPPSPSAGGSQHKTHIHSQLSFDRGEDLRITFRFWGDPEKGGEFCCWGGPFPANSMFGGPWHKGQYGLLFDQEAIVRYWGWNDNDRPHFAQPGDPWVGTERQETWMSDNFRSAFDTSVSKETSMLIQVWLGDVDGAMMRWSDDDANTWNLEHDFRGVAPLAASSTKVFAGWGPYSGAIFLDDIQIENNSRLGSTIGNPPPNAADSWMLY